LSEPSPGDVLVVLAGGRSRRFGSDKALATLDDGAGSVAGEKSTASTASAPALAGEPLALRALRRLAPLARRRVLVRAWPIDGLPRDVQRVLDPRPGEGPLQALAAAFAAAPAARWLVAPCDVPGLEPSIYVQLRNALGDAEVAVARAAGRLEPLVSVWTPAAVRQLDVWLAREPQLAVHVALGRLRSRVIDFADPAPFVNVNAPADLELARIGARP
jgi:molybdopterin-guanine dinucleotide biosynthesis protein A